MENIEYSNSLYQVNEIIKYITPNLKARIPKKFIIYIENNKSENYDWKIDETIPLYEQDLLPTTKEILTVLYKDYMCDDVERAEIEKILNDNEIKYQEELKEKYNPNNMFNNKAKEVTDTVTEDETKEVVAYKESFFRKIINKIKLIFHK